MILNRNKLYIVNGYTRILLWFFRLLAISSLGLLPFLLIMNRGASLIFSSNQDQSFVIVASIVILFLILVVTPNNVWSKVSGKYREIEWYLYRRCIRYNGSVSNKLKCWIVPVFLKKQSFKSRRQIEVVNEITSSLINNNECKVSIILGPSASGKTHCINEILKQISQSSILRGNIKSLYYYDIIDSNSYKSLLNNIGGSAHSDSLVFVDNLHCADDFLLKELTSHISNKIKSEYHFVLLGQNLDKWRLNPSESVKLIDSVRNDKALYNLDSFLRKEIDVKSKNEYYKEIYERNMESVASAYQTIIISSINFRPLMEVDNRKPIINLLSINRKYIPDDTLLERVAVVLSLSLHRGYFTLSDFLKTYLVVVNNRDLLDKAINIIYTLRWIRDMKILGVFPVLSTGNNRYIFHEKMAEEWKDTLSQDKEIGEKFLSLFNKAVKSSMYKLPSNLKWFMLVEIFEKDNFLDTYGEAIFDCNLNQMTSCLKRNYYKFNDDNNVRLLYAFLLDKSGNFSKSRNEVNSLDINCDPSSSIFINYALISIESSHGKESLRLIKELKRSKLESVRLIANYWECHISAHSGLFQPKKMINILSLLESKLIKGYYYQENSLSRLFFDSCRHVYLSGKDIYNSMRYLYNHSSNEVISNTDNQYHAFHHLYFSSHWFCHEFMFRKLMLGQTLKHEEILDSFVFEDIDELTSNESILLKAKELYKESISLFSLVGGKEGRYLEADILNIEILLYDIGVDESASESYIESKIKEYKDFIFDTGFEDIYSYPYFYEMKWNLINSYKHLLLGNSEVSDMYKFEAFSAISNIVKYDSLVGNNYGLWRARLFKALVGYDSKNKNSTSNILKELDNLKHSALQNNYFRDLSIINWLLRDDGVSPLDIIKLLRYYPFVHQ